MNNTTKPSKGTILISEPFLADPYFKRSVVLLSEHTEEGSIGFILNKPTNISVNEAISDFPQIDSMLYFGGPVQTDSLQYIHRLGDKLEGSQPIFDGLYWGGNLEKLKEMISLKQVQASDIRFFVGYSGWDSTQLNQEIDEKSWIVSQGATQHAFFDEPKKLWSDVLKSMGNEFRMLANYPEDPSLN